MLRLLDHLVLIAQAEGRWGNAVPYSPAATAGPAP